MPTLSVKRLSARITLAMRVILTTGIGTFAFLASLYRDSRCETSRRGELPGLGIRRRVRRPGDCRCVPEGGKS